MHTAGKAVPALMEAKLKKEKGNEAVRQFRIRQKEKELADKERAEMLRKENMEMEIRVASYQQVREIFFFSVLDLNQFFSESFSIQKFVLRLFEHEIDTIFAT